MKKSFEQPELMVVRVKNNIVTTSLRFVDGTANEAAAGDRMGREDWDAGY